MAQHFFQKPFWVVLAFLMGCSFQSKDFELSGVKSRTNIALPLAFGEVTIVDIIERQYTPPGIVVNDILKMATGVDGNIVLDDTVDLDLGDLENSEILGAALKIDTENEMPIEGSIQFILVDNTYAVIETLIPDDKTIWIRPSSVDGSGALVTKGVFNETVELSKVKIDKLFEAKRMIVKARLTTKKDNNGIPQLVSFKSSLKLNNHYGLQITLKTQVDI